MKNNYSYFDTIRADLGFDPIFGHVMSKKENCLKMLQLALPKLNIIKIVKISPQKHISIKLLEKASRFDVWAVDDKGRKYDIECQTVQSPYLLKRAWHYINKLQSTAEPIKPGEDYDKITASYVLFFCTFDPFGKGRAKYSFSFHEDTEISWSLDELGHLVFFNSKAKDKSMISPEFGEFLNMIDGKIQKHPSKFVIKLNDDIHEYVNTDEWGDFVNTFQSFKERIIERSRAEGMVKGIAEGKAAGIIEGRNEERKNSVKMVASVLRTDTGTSDEQILAILTKKFSKYFTQDQLIELIKES